MATIGAPDVRARTTNTSGWLVRRVLEGLEFPAQRWQIIAHADFYGVDGVTGERLRRLPPRVYRDCGQVLRALQHPDTGP